MKFRNILSLILVLGTLTSCGLLDRLGFDTYDYMSESVTKTHDASGETAVMLEELLMILVTDSPVLPTFDNMSDAITFYRDAVLEHLLASDYAKYSGNGKLIGRSRCLPFLFKWCRINTKAKKGRQAKERCGTLLKKRSCLLARNRN